MKKHIKQTIKVKPIQRITANLSAIRFPIRTSISIAGELDTLARQRLPDRVLQGNLAGYEDEIRQDAILLALSWYLRNRADTQHRVKYPWHSARALAGTQNPEEGSTQGDS